MPHAAAVASLPTGTPAGRAAAPTVSATPQAPVPGIPRRIAIRTSHGYWIIPVDSIVRISADDNYVVVRADRDYRRKGTLDAFLARLDPARFVRVHRSQAVNVAAVRELAALGRGEFRLVLQDGTSVRTGRCYTAAVTAAFGLD